MKTSSLSNWPNPLTGDHLAELGRVVGAEAPLLMISHKHSLRTLMAASLGRFRHAATHAVTTKLRAYF